MGEVEIRWELKKKKEERNLTIHIGLLKDRDETSRIF